MAPNPTLRGRSPCDVFRIRDISEASICIYLDSVSKELFKIGAIWINGCGTNCFLSVHIKNATFSKWITNTVITEPGTLSRGPVPELRTDLGTPCPEGWAPAPSGAEVPAGLLWAGRGVPCGTRPARGGRLSARPPLPPLASPEAAPCPSEPSVLAHTSRSQSGLTECRRRRLRSPVTSCCRRTHSRSYQTSPN